MMIVGLDIDSDGCWLLTAGGEGNEAVG